MKIRWRGSAAAKAGAWIGIVLSGCVFLGSVLGIILITEMDIYDYSEKEFRRQAYESVAEHYAVIALANMEPPENGKMQHTFFRYGIIKADKIDNMDFNDENIYVERNFKEPVEADDLYMIRHEMGENTEFDYSGTLFGGYGLYGDVETYLINKRIHQICYNRESGIFYYEGSSEFYPVQDVGLYRRNEYGGDEVYFFQYDFDRKMYRNEAYVREETTTEGAVALESNEGETARDAQDILLRREYITFDMFDGTEMGYNTWGDIMLDGYNRKATAERGVETLIADEGMVFLLDSGYFAGRPITTERYYTLEDNILHIEHVDERETDTYWVVVDLPESVGFGWNSDLFVQANFLVRMCYSLRYSIYLILAASIALGIFCFVFLIRAAGHRKGTEEITATWLDRMPFDIYLGFAGFAELFLIFVASEMRYGIGSWPAIIGFGAVLLSAMCFVALLTVLTFAVRVKLGKWWRNTVVWWICHKIFVVCRALIQNIGLIYKSLLLIGGVSLVELFVIAGLGYRIKNVVIFWFVEKIIFVPLFLFAIFQMQKLKEGGEALAEGDLHHQVDTERMFWEFKQHGENLNNISEGISRAVGERMKSEHFKTELITNVSHDIKTPLTSIINYVDLLEKEELENETVREYLDVLDRQSARLKKLIEDLMEASKASTGNLAVNLEELEAGVSMVQTVGEFEEKMKANELNLLIGKPDEPVYIMADSRHFWRVIDNLMNNICKYAQPGTRVYINLERRGECALLTFRNTSKYPLNITSEELMERFVRGDSSRNTEGSGLGISIAKSLMELMGGTFELYVDGDLFKVVIGFQTAQHKM